jgi:type 1 glutamine amidotransferase
MFSLRLSVGLAGLLLLASLLSLQAEDRPDKKRIVLVAGETAKVDVVGHHDYLAGCRCLEVLLNQTENLETVRVNDGWPDDAHQFDGAGSIVFYTDGGGKQAFLSSPERIAMMQSLVDSGVGLVMIHQAVDFPNEFAMQGKAWLGGVYLQGKSGRGHWNSKHIDFPEHPITRGVTPWQINDGWLNELQFADKMRGIQPLVWSGKEYEESRPELQTQIVSWAYERPDGGRSFSFTGLDAHSAWELAGMRQLMVNGVLWSAKVDIPEKGAPCQIEKAELQFMQTPREPKPPAKPAEKKS